MNHERDIDRLLDRWLGDGATEAPDRVLDVVTARIERQPQRPAWRLLWRDIHVRVESQTAVVVGALTVLAVAIVATLMITSARPAAIGSSPTPFASGASVVTSPSPEASPLAPSAAPTAPDASSPNGNAPSSAVPHLPTAGCEFWTMPTECSGPVTAGTHSSVRFGAPFSYTVPKGWVNSTDDPTLFALVRPETVSSEERIQLWMDPLIASQGLDNCLNRASSDGVPSVDDWLSFLAGEQDLTVTSPAHIALGNATGTYVDVRMTGDPRYVCNKSGRAQPVVTPVTDGREGGMHWSLTRDVPQQFLFLETKDGTVVLVIVADGGTGKSFGAITKLAMPVIESFTFGH